MAKSLHVEVIGDTRSYARSLKEASHATESFGSTLGKLAKGVVALGAAYVSLDAVKTVVETAVAAQEANDKLTVAFKNQRIELEATSPAVLALEESSRQLGFTNADTREGLLRLVNAGKPYAEAVKEMKVAQDLARVSGKSLGDSTTDLIRLQAGNTRAAKQYGIVLAPITAAQDKLKASKKDLTTAEGKHLLALAKVQDKLATGQAYYDQLTQKVKGQGDAFASTAAGGMARFHAQLGNLEESLGAKLLPALGTAAGAISDFMDKLSKAPTFTAKVHVVFETAEDMFTSLRKKISEALVGKPLKFGGPEGMRVDSDKVTVEPGLLAKMDAALKAVNWGKLGREVGDAIVNSMNFATALNQKIIDEFAKATANINFTALLGGLARGIVKDRSVGNAIEQMWLFSFRFSPAGMAFTIATTFTRSIRAGIMRGAASVVDAAAGVGRGIISGVDRGLTGLVNKVQGWFQRLWAWIRGAASSAAAFAFSVGAAIPEGIWHGITSAAGSLWGKLTSFTGSIKSKVTFGLLGSPRLFTYYLGKQLVQDISDALNQGAGAVTSAATKLTGGLKTGALKGMGNAAAAIVAAAKKYRVDVGAALAVAKTEGGTSFGAVGDRGTSFGPFQMHIGGALGNMSPAQGAAFANSIRGIDAALRMMAQGGAAGKTGFDAIAAIVRNFERPADPSGEIQKALGFYKQIPGAIGGGLTEGAKAAAALVKSTLAGMVNLVKEFGPKIGAEHVKGIIAGLVQGQPTLVQQARTAILELIAAQKQAVADGRAALLDSFRSLATDALSAFDAVASAWKPPAQRLLDKMQLQDQIKSATAAVADAQATVDAAVAAQQALTRGPDETDAEFAARQAQAQTDVETAVKALGEAQRSFTEFQLGLNAAQQQRAHDRQMAADREHLAANLTQLEGFLAKHPEAYATMQERLLRLLARYHVPMYTAGQKLASRFADGLDDGIGAVVATARKLANALEAITGPVGGGGGAGGPPRPPDVGSKSTGQPLQVHTSIQLDGREIARSVTDHQIRYGMSNVSTGLA